MKSYPPLPKLEVGDRVVRYLGGFVPGAVKMALKVTAVTEKTVVCGAWTFDKVTGGEIDEELGWDACNTGSIIKSE
jgi:hypothetical protein